VPVIGSDSGEIPHVIGSAGRIVPEADVAGWAQAITQLLERPEECEALRRCGLSRAAQYSTVTIAEQYRQYYRWLGSQPLS